MKKPISNIANRKARLVWYGLVITLIVCTVINIFNWSANSNDRSFPKIELLKDNILAQSQLVKRPSIFSTWISVYQQKQILEVIQGKDSLTNQDKQLIKQIDQQLNTMLHERN